MNTQNRLSWVPALLISSLFLSCEQGSFTDTPSRTSTIHGSAGGVAAVVLPRSWATIGDQSGAVGKALLASSSGALYSAGESFDSAVNGAWIVSKSVDGGASFSTVDSYSYPGSSASVAYTMTEDSQGRIYAGGQAFDSSNVSHWILRVSSDDGVTWSTVDDQTNVGDPSASLDSLSADSTGNVYAAGATQAGWVIRKTSDGGAHWAEVDRFSSNFSGAYVTGIAASSAGAAVFACGYAFDSSSNIHWIMRMSADGGATWSTADDFISTGNFPGAYATGVLIAPSGAVFATGAEIDDTGAANWTTRLSADGGATWNTVDSYQFPGGDGSTAWGTAIGVGADGAIYVVGDGGDPSLSGGSRWIVRKSVDLGLTWATDDSYLIDGGQDSEPSALAVDSSGSVYVNGLAVDGAGNSHWITRKY